MAMDCSSQANPGGLSLSHGPVPALPTEKRKLQNYKLPLKAPQETKKITTTSTSQHPTFSQAARNPFEKYLATCSNRFRLSNQKWRDIRRILQQPDTPNATSKMKWTALNEYLISDAGALVKKTSMTQQAEGVGNREVSFEHEVYDIIVSTHLSLLHVRQV